MINDLIEITLYINQYYREDGRLRNDNIAIVAPAFQERIYQSRLDKMTEYTKKLKYRLRVMINDANFDLSTLDINNDISKVELSSNVKSTNLQVLNIEKAGYNSYIIEIGSSSKAVSKV